MYSPPNPRKNNFRRKANRNVNSLALKNLGHFEPYDGAASFSNSFGSFNKSNLNLSPNYEAETEANSRVLSSEISVIQRKSDRRKPTLTEEQRAQSNLSANYSRSNRKVKINS